MKQIDLVVVDVGNSACKVGEVQAEQLLHVHRIDLDECSQQPWRHHALAALTSKKHRWILSGSNPPVIGPLADWLQQQQQSVAIIDDKTPLPLKIDVEFPEKVGRDRLLQALAVDAQPAIIISAGTAITVDALDAEGHFLGGAIFPGLGLMAKALHDHTAQLPLVESAYPRPALPAKNTENAMRAGIMHAVAGGIAGCVHEMKAKLAMPPHTMPIFLTGGDGPVLRPLLGFPVTESPHLSLEGIIVASRTLFA